MMVLFCVCAGCVGATGYRWLRGTCSVSSATEERDLPLFLIVTTFNLSPRLARAAVMETGVGPWGH